MYCRYCGSKNEEKARFCVSCGKEIGKKSREEEIPKNEQPSVVIPRKESTLEKNKGLIAVLAIILVVLFVLSGEKDNQNSPEGTTKKFLNGVKNCNKSQIVNSSYFGEGDYDDDDVSEFATRMCNIVDSYQILKIQKEDEYEATAKIKVKSEKGEETGVFYLTKINNKWFVDVERTF